MDASAFTVGSVSQLTTEFTRRNNAESVTLQSSVPAACLSEPCVLGVDEAGRGPVLGPMVYGVCYCVAGRVGVLSELGCADSKSLTEEKREQIFEQLCAQTDCVGWAVEAIAPTTICNSMLRRQKCSLNQVAQDSTVALVRRVLCAGVNLTDVFVDTVGPADKYQAVLAKLFPRLRVTVEKKADASFPVVSAASICAKVSRDRALAAWSFQEGLQLSGDAYGSGYPNDPVTKAFLVQNVDRVFGFPQLVRFSWSTAGRVLEERAARVQWEDEEADCAPITAFFQPRGPRQRATDFLLKRNLSRSSAL
ncbi:ribonuclease H2 subunit A [Bacillus rossius redtenbacheri]|uniref:ribonuclease H2 subunit A n=1 Tax=Bacillus rossius redtenbacheri TaxID=93214 RepID=UPI002FDE808A